MATLTQDIRLFLLGLWRLLRFLLELQKYLFDLLGTANHFRFLNNDPVLPPDS